MNKKTENIVENRAEEKDVKKVVVTSDGVTELTVLDYDANSKLIKVSYRGEEFYVVNTKSPVLDYAKYVQEHR